MNLFTYFSLHFQSFVSKVGDRSWGRPEGFLFNSYYTEVYGRALLPSLDCSILPLIRTLYCWVLSMEVSSTIFKVFGMTRPRIEPRSPGSLANTLPTRPMSRSSVVFRTTWLISSDPGKIPVIKKMLCSYGYFLFWSSFANATWWIFSWVFDTSSIAKNTVSPVGTRGASDSRQ